MTFQDDELSYALGKLLGYHLLQKSSLPSAV